MNIILFDQEKSIRQLLPFTYTRPVAAIRVGILTIAEKWQHYFPSSFLSFATQNYLQEKYPLKVGEENIIINSSVCPSDTLANTVHALPSSTILMQGDRFIAAKATSEDTSKILFGHFSSFENQAYEGELLTIDFPWDIFQKNGVALRQDFHLLTEGRSSELITDPFTRCYAPENIFLEKGASVKAAILNAEDGPIYIGKNAQICEGAIVKGPLALGEGAVVNMGAKLKGDNTIGPYCKIGGEVSNTVFFGFSNKSHDGFLGNAVIGEWCNLGADTNASNLKNNYATIKVWNFATDGFFDTGLQFCGLLMGDHSKAGINTMFNTATVVGVGANIYGDGFPRTFIPSFAWGGAAGFTTFKLSKMLDVAAVVMRRRGLELGEVDSNILRHVYELSSKYRTWEKK